MSAFRSNRGIRKPYSRPNANEQWVHDRAPGATKTVPNNDEKPRLPPSTNQPTTKLQVSNLHYEVTPKDLTSIFGQIGTLVREPMIRYDRSGRSSGVAIISYETSAEATRAKKQFDGILAKGQLMSVTYDSGPPRATRRAVSGPPLINRIQRPALKERLAADDSQIRDSTGSGPVRARPRRGGKSNASRPASKKPKTAEELDKELDAFMGDSDSSPATTSAADVSKVSESKVAPAPIIEDVDMA